MQPDRTLVQLVSWVNLIEAENEKLLTLARQLQEKGKKDEATITELQGKLDKLSKPKKQKEPEED